MTIHLSPAPNIMRVYSNFFRLSLALFQTQIFFLKIHRKARSGPVSDAAAFGEGMFVTVTHAHPSSENPSSLYLYYRRKKTSQFKTVRNDDSGYRTQVKQQTSKR